MANKNSATTQNYLDIHDITNDMVILKNGTVSVIVAVDAMNFGLLAEEEQDSIMYAYAGMLNSLNYPIQVIIKSQTKDVTSYLKILEQQESQASLRVNQRRIRRYREFVSNLIRERNVLDKKFYISIPATPLELGLLTAQSVLPGSADFNIDTIEKNIIIEKGLNLLGPKLEHVIGQFARIGLYSRQLNTQEIIQLFYANYNPEAVEGQRLTDSRQYTTPLVQASIENTPMQNTTAAPGVTTPAQQPVVTQNEPATTPVSAPSAAPVTPVQQPPAVPTEQPVPAAVEVETPQMETNPTFTSSQPQEMSAPQSETPVVPVAQVTPVAPVPPVTPSAPAVATPPTTAPGTTPEEADLQAQINQQVVSLDANQS